MMVVRPKPMHEYNQIVAQRDEFTRNFYKEVRSHIPWATDQNTYFFVGLEKIWYR